MVVGLLLGVMFVTPLVVGYALFVRWCDRFEPEPWWLLVSAFVYGAVFATVGGGVLSAVAERFTASVAGVDEASEWMDRVGATIVAPLFEEGFKGLGVALIALASWAGLRELDGPLDGAIYGGIIGLGFTLTEDTLYVASSYAQGGLGDFFGLLFVRTFLLGLSHCTFTALTGLGFGLAAESENLGVRLVAPPSGLIAAMGLHALHNGLPTFFGGRGTLIMMVLSWIIDMIFFVLLAVLVVRDRAIVLRELEGEVGSLVHPHELRLVTTYFWVGYRHGVILFTRGWEPFRARREKQLALVELAFVKSRRRRGEFGRDLDVREARLRETVARANHLGIWLGHVP